jgi:DNA-binding MarR family transcriptional regulator
VSSRRPAAKDQAGLANVLGAFALAVDDRAALAVAQAGGLTGTDAAAVSALYHFLDRPTLDRLRAVLGLTHSGAVRLVDRLSDAGLVTREPGMDGRSRSVRLTPAGREAAEAMTAARAATLTELIRGLSTRQRSDLTVLLAQLMAGVVAGKDGGAWICRLCDTTACGRAEGRCPTANAAADKYGTD